MTRAKFRLGILMPKGKLPAWVVFTLEQIRDSEFAEIVLLLTESEPPKLPFFDRLIEAYLGLEGRAFHIQPQAVESQDAGNLLDGIPSLVAAQTADKELRAANLDLILHLGRFPASVVLAETARLGLLQISDGRRIVRTGDAAGFFEMLERKPVTTCEIRIFQSGASRVIRRATLATDPLSVSRNRSHFFWKAALLLPRAVRWVFDGREFAGVGETNHFSGSRPNVLDLMRLVPAQVIRFLGDKIRKRLTRDQWILMTTASRPEDPIPDWKDFRSLIPPRDRLWGDPFVLERDGKYYVFVEELVYKKKRGHIACLTLDAQGRLLENRVVLEMPYHLSYPFLLEHNGQLFMIPETMENQTIEVYRCVSFPYDWQFHKTLMSGISAVDTTLLEHVGKWWLFANVRTHPGGSTWDELCLFWADEPFAGNWTPHPLNPVVTDVSSARPAGRIAKWKEGLLRPSQDCSRRYGYAIKFNRITRLTETEFVETVEYTLEPDRGSRVLATHTFNRSAGMTVIDAVTRRVK